MADRAAATLARAAARGDHGPADRKMMINALNSGADSYMADFEDSNTPSWCNQLQGQINLKDANERALFGVRHDKARDARDGFDRGWVAHPGLQAARISERLCLAVTFTEFLTLPLYEVLRDDTKV